MCILNAVRILRLHVNTPCPYLYASISSLLFAVMMGRPVALLVVMEIVLTFFQFVANGAELAPAVSQLNLALPNVI